jgi:hypothetical protein
MYISVAPILLSSGESLFAGLDPSALDYRPLEAEEITAASKTP